MCVKRCNSKYDKARSAKLWTACFLCCAPYGNSRWTGGYGIIRAFRNTHLFVYHRTILFKIYCLFLPSSKMFGIRGRARQIWKAIKVMLNSFYVFIWWFMMWNECRGKVEIQIKNFSLIAHAKCDSNVKWHRWQLEIVSRRFLCLSSRTVC